MITNGIPDPVLIVGCARSGTSMTAAIVAHGGAWGGGRDDMAWNPRGTFENSDIRNGVIKSYLMSLGADPSGQNPLPRPEDVSPRDLRSKIHAVIKFQGYRDGPWFFKCTKTVHFWQEMHRNFPAAKWVLVRRNDEDIVASCMNTGFMRGYSDEDGWRSWLAQHHQRFDEMRIGLENLREVWPSKFVVGDFSEVRSVMEWLGLRFDQGFCEQFINPAWWSQKRRSGNGQ